MRRRIKIIASWVLILSMAVGALPGAMAFDLSQDIEVQGSWMEPMRLADANQLVDDSKAPTGATENHCLNSFSSETCHSFSLYTPFTELISEDYVSLKETTACYDRVASRYPELPKRPPKA